MAFFQYIIKKYDKIKFSAYLYLENKKNNWQILTIN